LATNEKEKRCVEKLNQNSAVYIIYENGASVSTLIEAKLKKVNTDRTFYLIFPFEMLDRLQQFNLSKNSVAIFSLADDFVGKSVIINNLKLMHNTDHEFPFGEFLLSKQTTTKQNEPPEYLKKKTINIRCFF
jgi:hypothetical protein